MRFAYTYRWPVELGTITSELVKVMEDRIGRPIVAFMLFMMCLAAIAGSIYVIQKTLLLPIINFGGDAGL